jgi:choline-sulfatase
MDKRPNILFLMSDQHRPDVIGYAGNRVVRTPVLDALATDGVVFDNAYTPSPICIPGRQCMMSGQLPHTCKCYRFNDDLPPNSNTFARLFTQYAYNTVCFGKLHHVGYDQQQGWRERIGADCGMIEQYTEGRRQEEFDRYRPTVNQWWPYEKEVRRAGIGTSPYVRRDLYCVEGFEQFVEELLLSPFYDREKRLNPLLLKVSLNSPHYPYLTDAKRFTYYLNRVQPFLNQRLFDHPVISQEMFRVEVGQRVTERDVRRATAAYYGMIEAMDEMYGRVLDALRHAGEDLDDWIILYTTDHGDMIGQHGVWMKYQYFEASARVPLIIRWPKRFAPRTVTQNVNLCDLFATLCDLAGLPIPAGLDSRSLVRLMAGDAGGWHNEAISGINDTLMIKQDDLKYQWYGTRAPEVLFDLRADPQEMTNVIDDPKYAEPVGQFRRRLAALGYGPQADANYVNAGYQSYR